MYDVMIVDDEPGVRNGLICFINWHSLDCKIVCEASNGIEAKNLLQLKHIDIVITDIKMPGVNGIELSQYIYADFPNIKVIILTGFADFSFAQSAIKYGIVDFVLKPTSTEKILDAVSKAKKMIIEQSCRENKLLELEKMVYPSHSEKQEKLFNDILSGKVLNDTEIVRKLEDLSIKINKFVVLVFETPVKRIHESAYDKDSSINQQLTDSFENYLSLSFKDYFFYNIHASNRFLCTIVSFEYIDYSGCMKMILKTCEEILNMAGNYADLYAFIGISSLHENPSEIKQAYNEALIAISEKFYDTNNIFIYSSELTNRPTEEKILLNEDICRLINFVQTQNHEGAISVMNNILKKQKNKKESIEYVKNICISVCSLCSKILWDHGTDMANAIDIMGHSYEEILKSESISNLSEILSSVLKSIMLHLSSNEKYSNYAIQKAMEYLKNNFNKSFDLQSIAQYVHMNGSYLSRLFKKITGETLTEAITKLRVEKAKELLTHSNYKAYEIASMVGIEDQTYFSILFKKHSGMSPKEFRQTQSNR